MFRRFAGRPPVEGRSPQPGPAFRAPRAAASRARTAPAGRLVTSLVAALALLAGSAALTPSLSAATEADPAQEPYGANDAPVLIVLGQSNALGFTTPIDDPVDVAQCASFAHVKGLKQAGNRVAGALNATWTPYTCLGSNLGQEKNVAYSTYNTATLTALRWERAIQHGENLPDLNVIHVAWASQGIRGIDGTGHDRWWPDREQSDVESLHQLTVNTISNGLRALQDAGKRPRIIGMHWNQWEADADAGMTESTQNIQKAFRDVLEPLRTITGGGNSFPIFLYYPRRTAYDATELQRIRDALTGLAALPEPNAYEMLDAANATSATGTPLYNPSIPRYFGIFTDSVHYTREVHEWFVDRQWRTVFTDHRFGAPVERTVNAAPGRPATQSSTYGDDAAMAASRAVDGNTTATSLSQTKLDANPWWQVKLVGQLPIRGVRILNRTDDCCKARLSNFYLIVSATDLTGQSWADIQANPDPRIKRLWVKGTAPDQITLPAGVTGRYVRIQLAGTNYLSLKEVLVDVPVAGTQ
ncbi:discoidin domain-containing protein [Kitasatospora herbaricolor]|uniref:Discoidin domain-containing protein n=1 Tax=Kitasatospora herbaricolor TaxID=68217 RepID=A0ABZ1WGR7_9ACTN|nr:discoidin domain-containing protein [Kitasatospora herbaricolor]